VDTCGLLLEILVTPASTQDRDGGRRLLWRLRHDLPTIRLVWADAGYAGKLVIWAQQVLALAVQIVRKRQGIHHFEVLPRRWMVRVMIKRLARQAPPLPTRTLSLTA
jgi:transposase